MVFAAFVTATMLPTTTNAADIYWVGGTGSKSWSETNNWDLVRRPAWGDTVYITNSVNLTFSTDPAADSIRVSGGNVTFSTGSCRMWASNARSSEVEVAVGDGFHDVVDRKSVV